MSASGQCRGVGAPRTLEIPASVLVAILLGWFALDALLMLRFLGMVPGWVLATIMLPVAFVGRWLLRHPVGDRPGSVPLARLGVCLALALMLCILAGEGRLLYANVDWQVRDAILFDMIRNDWPFAYVGRGGVAEMLRGPIGVYLVPALAGKLGGRPAADLALLAQNATLLAALLALGSTLFANARARLIALAVVLVFSGLDGIGESIRAFATGTPLNDHMEWWTTVQFSAHISQLFWVPQYALAGWAGALFYLLWRDRRLGIGPLAAAIPLTALWSPLSAIGLLPFAAHAAMVAFRTRTVGRRDIALPALATVLMLPALAYLAAAGESVGMRFYSMPPLRYALFESLEMLPYATILAVAARHARFGGAPLAITIAVLLAVPLIQIGQSTDFAMRASIPALLILAIGSADLLARNERLWLRIALVVILAIGSLTGLSEIRRALAWPASPLPRCSFFGAWDVTFGRYGKSTYLAPVDALPGLIRPAEPRLVAIDDPSRCWDRPWPRPTGID